MELIQVAEAVAREKNIDKEIVVEAIREAIEKAGKSKYGYEQDIRAIIDTKGNITLKRYRTVATEEEEAQEDEGIFDEKPALLTLAHAKRIDPDIERGGEIIDDLPPLDFGRIAAQTAKQTLFQKVREAERAKQYTEFKDKVGEIVNGRVKRVEYGNVTIDLGGKGEGLMRRDESIPRENFKMGDPVRALIYEVREEARGPQIFMSRTHPEFMAKLFTQEVPEIYEGVIEIKTVARDPGSRAKIGVIATDGSIDPVGACVGMRGSRVQAVVNELMGEKIDIIPWSEDVAAFAINALQPAEVVKVILDEEAKRMEVAVPEDQLSKAIGSRGQNVRLASMLLGWDIDLMSEAEESERRAEEFKARSNLFMEALDVDDVIAHLLVAEGFISIEDLVDATVEELAQIEGFDEGVAGELQDRAQVYLDGKAKELSDKQSELGLNNDLTSFEYLSSAQILKLGENGIKSRDDLADLAGDELIELLGEGTMSQNRANDVIMAARAHWFDGEEEAEDESSEPKAKTESESDTEAKEQVA